MRFSIIPDFRKENRISGVLIGIFSVYVFFLLFMAIESGLRGQDYMRNYQPDTGENCYRLSNLLAPERVKKLYLEKRFDALAAFQQLLKEPSEEFTYATIAERMISINRKLDDTFLYGYDKDSTETVTPRCYLSVQINAGMSRKANLIPEEGRGFHDEDFALSDGEPLAVLLGNELKTYYAVGDTIPFSYRGVNQLGTVIGILPPDSKWEGGRMSEIFLDRAFVLPDLDQAKITESNMSLSNQDVIYNMGRGYFYTNLPPLQMQNRIEAMLADSGLQTGDFCLEGITPLHWDSMGLTVSQTIYLIRFGLFLVYAIVLGLFMITGYRQVGRAKGALITHLLCGAGKKRLIASIACVVAARVLVISLGGIMITLLALKRIAYPVQLLLFILITAALAGIPPAVRIAHLDVIDGIGRERE